LTVMTFNVRFGQRFLAERLGAACLWMGAVI
jgi:hypothetical protein